MSKLIPPLTKGRLGGDCKSIKYNKNGRKSSEIHFARNKDKQTGIEEELDSCRIRHVENSERQADRRREIPQAT